MQTQTTKRVIGLAGALLLAGLAGLSFTQQQTIARLRGQLGSHQASLAELDRLRKENEEARQLKDQQSEIERLEANTKDLMRLRNENRQLRNQLQDLDSLRTANAQLLQAVQGARSLQSNDLALITAARKQGSILGVAVRPPAAGQAGVEITAVDPNSPVAGSGLQAGDIIVALDGRPVATPAQLQAEMLTHNPGETVVVDVLRSNAVTRYQVKTRAWPE